MDTILTTQVGSAILSVLAALAILIVGWIVATIVSGIVRTALKRTSLDNRVAASLGAEPGKGISAEDWISKGVFYLLMLLVLIAFFETLHLTIVTEPLNQLLTQLVAFLPRLLSAGILIVIAWLLATIVRRLFIQVATSAHLDERLTRSSGEQVSITKTLGDVAYYLIFLVFLPPILEALAIQGLLTPITAMIDKVLAFIPNIVAAAVIFIVGWFIAGIVRKIVTGLLSAAGIDGLAERVGIARALGQQKLSALLGLLVFILIMLPVLTAALDALALQAITQPVSNMLNTILNVLPNLLAAAIVLVFSYLVGRVIATFVTELLAGMGFNTLPARLGFGHFETTGARSPAGWVGFLVLAGIMLFAFMEAAQILGFGMVATMVSQFTVLAGQVVFGLVIFALGLYIANLVAEFVKDSGMANANLLATLARVAILVLVGAMALREMGIANDIVSLAFTLVLGAMAVAAAIAFGLGGRDTAGRLLARMEQSLENNPPPPMPPSPPAPPPMSE